MSENCRHMDMNDYIDTFFRLAQPTRLAGFRLWWNW